MNKPSGWLQAVCIVAIVLGVLGVLASLFGLAGLVVGPRIQASMRQSQAFAVPEEQMKIQLEMQEQIEEVGARWYPVTVPLLLIECIVSVCLIVGGVRSLRLRPTGRMLLVGVLWAAIVLELVQLIPKVAIGYETATIATNYMSRIMETSAPQGRQPPGMGVSLMTFGKAAMIAGIVLSVVVKLVETGFYVFGVIYLRRPKVRALFGPPVAAELAQGDPFSTESEPHGQRENW